MKATRRDFAKFAGGAAAGIFFTPVPWRLLDDSAKWTQNWAWLPKTPRGPITDAAARCTLCRAACPVRARCAGGVPTGLWPAGEALCPAGFVAHHLAYHPSRLREASTSSNEVVKALKARGTDGMAVLDLAPGRTGSYFVRHLLNGLAGAAYLEAPAIEGATAQAMSRLLKQPLPLALDLERTRTVLSIRTPLAEGWAAPKHVAARPLPFHLIQVDVERTHTAELAGEWLKVPGPTERELLLAVAAKVMDRVEGSRALPGFDELRGAAATADHPDAARIADQLLGNGLSAVLADGDPANGPLDRATVAVAASINLLLMLDGRSAFSVRGEAPLPTEWTPIRVTDLEAVPPQSIRTLLVDEPLPGCALNWDAVAQKLTKDALVVGVTWSSDGVARRADRLLPAPVFVEVSQDTPPSVDGVDAKFAVSRPFLPPPSGALDMPALLGQLIGQVDANGEQALRQRAGAIRVSGTGEVQKPGGTETAALATFEKDEDFWTAVKEGACWTAKAPVMRPSPGRLLPEGVTPTTLVYEPTPPATRSPGWRPAAASPLIAKLWRDSNYRLAPGQRLS